MEKKAINIEFALIRITTEQFAIIEEDFIKDSQIRLATNFRFAAERKKQMVAVFTAFKLEANEKPFLIVEGGCHFKIKEDAWMPLFDKKANNITFPKEFIQHLTMLTVGTTRGILHAKTENTCYNKYLLPTINVTEMVKEDITFHFNNQENKKVKHNQS